MSQPARKLDHDRRLEDILDVIFEYAAGNLKARGKLSNDDSALDGVMAGVNILGEELQAYAKEIRKANGALRQALGYAETLIRSSPDGIFAVDCNLRITEWNLHMEQMFRKSRNEVLGRNLEDIPFMSETGEAARIRKGIDGRKVRPREIAFRLPGSGKPGCFESLMAPLRGHSGRIQGVVVRIRDITSRRQAEDQLRETSLYARSLIEAGLDPLATINLEGKILDVNEAAAQATGVPREKLIGSDFSHYFTEPEKAYDGFRETFDRGALRNFPLTMRHVSGALTDVLCNASLLHDEKGEVAGLLAVARDITDRKRAEKAEELARRDSLTGLYNNRTFHQLLVEETVRTRRFNQPVSLLMLDIDRFKQINDTHGHQAGDVVLRSVSDLLMEQTRAVDHVCRYGGEEFTIILPQTDVVSAIQFAERLRADVQHQRFDVGDKKIVRLTVSIGVATYPVHADSPDGVVRAADVAVYAAKRAGRNRVSYYEARLAG